MGEPEYGDYHFDVKERHRQSDTTIKTCHTPQEVSKLIRRLQTGSAKGLTREIRIEVDQYASGYRSDRLPIDVYSIAEWFTHGEAKYKGILSATGQSSPLRHFGNAKRKVNRIRGKAGEFIKAQASKLAPAAILAFIRSHLGF